MVQPRTQRSAATSAMTAPNSCDVQNPNTCIYRTLPQHYNVEVGVTRVIKQMMVFAFGIHQAEILGVLQRLRRADGAEETLARLGRRELPGLGVIREREGGERLPQRARQGWRLF